MKQAVEIARTVSAAAEEWGRNQVIGGADKPDGSQKLLHAVELAKQMATGALKKWGEDKWAAFIQGQVPELRARLSSPAPAMLVPIQTIPPAPSLNVTGLEGLRPSLPPVSPELQRLLDQRP